MRGLTPGLTDQSIASAGVEDTAEQIHELVAAEFTLQETGGTVTATGAEQSLYLNDNPLGVFRPVAVFVDLSAMQQADTTVFRVYYRISAGGNLQLQDYQSYTGVVGGLANSKELIIIDLYPNRFGTWVTLEQTAGSVRDYPWSVFTEE